MGTMPGNKERLWGIQTRVSWTFFLFIALMVALLWLMQIQLLDQFYRYEKRRTLQNVSANIAGNIDNTSLNTLIERVAEDNGLCVLIVDENMQTVYSADTAFSCIIHHLNHRDLRRMAQKLETDGQNFVFFPMQRTRSSGFDRQRFTFPAPLPMSDDGAEYLVSIQRALLEDGSEYYVLLNTLLTPVTSTVQTIRSELWVLTTALLLIGFLLSSILSRRISRPIIQTTEAARALSQGEFTPIRDANAYREIAQLNRQLAQAARDLRKVEETQRELIANISHDLRTPLTLIEGYVEAMRDIPGENTPENLQVILDETHRLTTLVNAVLDYSRSQNAAPEENSCCFSLTESIREILTRYVKLTEQDGYVIRFRQQGEAFVRADPLKISQVVYNLINNALTYTGDDKTVTITQTIQNGRVRLSVTDTGEGIEPEELPYIWNRYYRGKKPHKRATVGTGLGLNIARSILDGYGMDYGAESTVGKGSTFWFEMETAGEEGIKKAPPAAEYHAADGAFSALAPFISALEHVQNVLLALYAHGAIHCLALTEDHQRGDGHDIVAGRQIGRVVHVQLNDLAVGELFGNFVHHGAEHLAGSAPVGVKIHQHRLGAA